MCHPTASSASWNCSSLGLDVEKRRAENKDGGTIRNGKILVAGCICFDANNNKVGLRQGSGQGLCNFTGQASSHLRPHFIFGTSKLPPELPPNVKKGYLCALNDFLRPSDKLAAVQEARQQSGHGLHAGTTHWWMAILTRRLKRGKGISVFWLAWKPTCGGSMDKFRVEFGIRL